MDQRLVLVTLNQQVGQVVQRLLGAWGGDFLLPYQAAQDPCYFNVQQLRGMHLFGSLESALHQSIRPVRAQQDFE